MLLLEMALAFAITFILYLLLKKTAGKLYRSYLLWEELHEEEARAKNPSKSNVQDGKVPSKKRIWKKGRKEKGMDRIAEKEPERNEGIVDEVVYHNEENGYTVLILEN